MYNYKFKFKIIALLVVINIANINSQKLKILIGSPVRQKSKILSEFLSSLERLNKKDYQVDYCFIDDNKEIESSNMLLDFKEKLEKQDSKVKILDQKTNDNYICNENGHAWTHDLIWKVAKFKNKIIDLAKTESYDYLFLIDSDLVLHQEVLNSLINAKKDIVSNVFWSKWSPQSMELPNAWLSDSYLMFKEQSLSKEEQIKKSLKFVKELRNPGIYKVGGLCGCTLVNKKALNLGISFSKIDNVSMWGEDRHFCIRATVLGLDLWMSTLCPTYHIYRESELAGVENFVKSCSK